MHFRKMFYKNLEKVYNNGEGVVQKEMVVVNTALKDDVEG